MNDYSPGAINVEGCVFDDFLLTNNLPPEKVPAVIVAVPASVRTSVAFVNTIE